MQGRARAGSSAKDAASQGDKRAESRRRVRFRSGKLALPDGTFLIECLIYDRSAEGTRLRVSEPGSVPDRVLLFDDESSILAAAEIVWRRASELGIRFVATVDMPNARDISRRLS